MGRIDADGMNRLTELVSLVVIRSAYLGSRLDDPAQDFNRKIEAWLDENSDLIECAIEDHGPDWLARCPECSHVLHTANFDHATKLCTPCLERIMTETLVPISDCGDCTKVCDCGEERPSGLMSCHHPGCENTGCDACGEIEWSGDPDDNANGDYFCEEHRS